MSHYANNLNIIIIFVKDTQNATVAMNQALKILQNQIFFYSKNIQNVISITEYY